MTIETPERDAILSAAEYIGILPSRMEAAISMYKRVLQDSEWKPQHDFGRSGMDIVRSRVLNNHVYFQGKSGDIYRVWLEFDGRPSLECVQYNAPLPNITD